jgi:hypothetical protein
MGDFRWRTIITQVKKKLGKSLPSFEGGDELLLKLKGLTHLEPASYSVSTTVSGTN